MKIYYLAPDNDRPSWGVGVIYQHVHILCSHGYDATIMHEKPGFKVTWMNVDVPVTHQGELSSVRAEDVVVIPEVMAGKPFVKRIPCRKILFVQAGAFLFHGLRKEDTHLALGFKEAFVIMPHLEKIVQKFTGLSTTLLPPFIADYFFKDTAELYNRKQKILLFPKFEQQDYEVLKRVISDELNRINPSGIMAAFQKKWELVEIKDKSHRQVASLMKEASFFIATNTFEAFNTAVPEAMAAGCINLCYEGFGPRDYLQPGINAFVFTNNEAYALAEKLFELIENYTGLQPVLQAMIDKGRATALEYTIDKATGPILQYYSTLLQQT